MNNWRRLSVVVFGVVCLLNEAFTQSDGLNLISAATPEATKAGAIIFEKGGNAADAAVAIAFALGVTEPAMSGIGGRTMLIVSIPDTPPVALGGISLTPAAVDTTITREMLTYYKQVAIPSQVKILDYLYSNYGSGNLSWAELVQPAITFAEEGFVLGVHRHQVMKRCEDKLKQSPHHNQQLLIDREIPFAGDTIKQPALARTLQVLATEGAQSFYKGTIAKEIALDFEENEGWIGLEDLQQFPEPIPMSPLHTTYRGYDIYSFNAPGGGWQILQMLNMLELIDQSQINKDDQSRNAFLMDIINKSHNDRLDHPIENYEESKEQLALKISKSYARLLLGAASNNQDARIEEKGQSGKGETTHFSVVDKTGMAISATSSIGAYYGSYASTNTLGFFYNSYVKSLMGFGLGKNLEPRTRIPSSMSPSVVRKDGKNVLVIGTPGSKRIVSTIAQLIQLWIDGDVTLEELIQKPRIHAIRHDVYLEKSFLSAEELIEIRKKGYAIKSPSYSLTKEGLNAYFGGVHAIAFKNGSWTAVADPRRDGQTYRP